MNESVPINDDLDDDLKDLIIDLEVRRAFGKLTYSQREENGFVRRWVGCVAKGFMRDCPASVAGRSLDELVNEALADSSHVARVRALFRRRRPA